MGGKTQHTRFRNNWVYPTAAPSFIRISGKKFLHLSHLKKHKPTDQIINNIPLKNTKWRDQYLLHCPFDRTHTHTHTHKQTHTQTKRFWLRLLIDLLLPFKCFRKKDHRAASHCSRQSCSEVTLCLWTVPICITVCRLMPGTSEIKGTRVVPAAPEGLLHLWSGAGSSVRPPRFLSWTVHLMRKRTDIYLKSQLKLHVVYAPVLAKKMLSFQRYNNSSAV